MCSKVYFFFSGVPLVCYQKLAVYEEEHKKDTAKPKTSIVAAAYCAAGDAVSPLEPEQTDVLLLLLLSCYLVNNLQEFQGDRIRSTLRSVTQGSSCSKQ